MKSQYKIPRRDRCKYLEFFVRAAAEREKEWLYGKAEALENLSDLNGEKWSR
jgi:hypothetical protein